MTGHPKRMVEIAGVVGFPAAGRHASNPGVCVLEITRRA